mmetsp:Transcript_123743/g.395977  ORF Transcript_123743/g.395977 Transcript_123743/m.395977 type:complete len:255 (-) Transcript_123743:1321-2085(-)
MPPPPPIWEGGGPSGQMPTHTTPRVATNGRCFHPQEGMRPWGPHAASNDTEGRLKDDRRGCATGLAALAPRPRNSWTHPRPEECAKDEPSCPATPSWRPPGRAGMAWSASASSCCIPCNRGDCKKATCPTRRSLNSRSSIYSSGSLGKPTQGFCRLVDRTRAQQSPRECFEYAVSGALLVSFLNLPHPLKLKGLDCLHPLLASPPLENPGNCEPGPSMPPRHASRCAATTSWRRSQSIHCHLDTSPRLASESAF